MELKYTTGNYELVDSKIINVLDNEFKVQIDGVEFWFGFADTKEFERSKIVANKEPEDNVYKIAVCNYDFDGIAGFFEPMPLGIAGGVQYYYNLAGWAIPGKEYSVIILNILREKRDV